MRGVTDTNTVVSGLLWDGPPYRLLFETPDLQLITSPALLNELNRVLHYPRLAVPVAKSLCSVNELVADYARMCDFVRPVALLERVCADPDDDAVLACALAARADVIVSGDKHLLNLKSYRGIRVLAAAELLTELAMAD